MRFICALCTLLICANVFAATVTVSMSQNGDAPSSALEMTRIIENAIMSEYFNSGQIVSNTQIIEGGSLSQKEMRSLVREAAIGRSDFLLSVYLEYEPNKKIVSDAGGVYASLKKADWQVLAVPSAQVVGSGSLVIKESKAQKNKPYESARAAAVAICKESLKAQAGAEEGKK